MKRMPFKRPTTYYDEKINKIDEQICKLIGRRKEISNNNPGYPPFEYISNWAEKFDLYEDQLKAIFISLWNEEIYRPIVEPRDFRMNLSVLKSIEIDKRFFSISYIHQYSNSSIVDLNVDLDRASETLDNQRTSHTNFKLYIDKEHDCTMIDGIAGNSHFHYKFIVSPPLPDNIYGTELIFKEYNIRFPDVQVGKDIVIQL